MFIYNHMVIYKHGLTLDKTFHALSDASRRQMLDILSEGKPCSATDLGKPLKMSQPAVSKHIKVLEQAGLATRHVEGRTHYFTLNNAPLDVAEDWIASHKAFWADAVSQLEKLAKSSDADDTQ